MGYKYDKYGEDESTGSSKGKGGLAGNAVTGLGQNAGAIGGAGKDILDWMGNDFQAHPGMPGPEMAESRARQGAGIPTLQRWAETGQGPSAAQAQLERARQANIANAASAAKSGTGLNTGARQRMAAEGEVAANLGAANEASQLRAQEQQKAMEMYQGALDAWRRGDIATYQAYAQAKAAAEAQNAETARENSKNRQLFGMAGLGAIGGGGALGFL